MSIQHKNKMINNVYERGEQVTVKYCEYAFCPSVTFNPEAKNEVSELTIDYLRIVKWVLIGGLVIAVAIGLYHLWQKIG